MNDSFFIDTNIFVYSVRLAEPQKRAHAVDLIDRAISTAKGVISYQVVQEFLNVAIRHYAQPMSLAECEEYLSTVFRPLLAVHSSQSLYIHALNLTRRYALSWYDSLIVAAASKPTAAFCTPRTFNTAKRLITCAFRIRFSRPHPKYLSQRPLHRLPPRSPLQLPQTRSPISPPPLRHRPPP